MFTRLGQNTFATRLKYDEGLIEVYMTTVDSLRAPIPFNPQDGVVFPALVDEAFSHPERSEIILRTFCECMEKLIALFSKSPDAALGKRLELSAECLTTLHLGFAQGTERHRSAIRNFEGRIDAVSAAAAGCFSAVPQAVEEQPPLKKVKQEEPPKPLDTNLSESLKRRDDDAALLLIATGASVQLLSPEDKNRLAEKAFANLNDQALAALIRGGCIIYDGSGQSPLLLQAISSNLIESVKALIACHANLHTTDGQKNTALHRAFLLGNPDMVELLFPHIDPQAVNAFGQTPLSALFNIHPDNLDYVQVVDQYVPIFLKTLFGKLPEELPGKTFQESEAVQMAMKISGGKLPRCPIDIVEMAFLIQDKHLLYALFSQIDTETFLSACSALEQKYPQASVALFATSCFALNPYHLQLGAQSAPIGPLKGKNPNLDAFLGLFDQLNFYHPEAAHYVDAVQWLQSTSRVHDSLSQEKAIKHLRGDLKSGLERTIHRVRYAGVPAYEPEKWFAHIELLLKHVINVLEEKKDPATTLNALKELRASFQPCATAVTTTAVNLYERLCFNIDTTNPRVSFFRSLANFRRLQFDDAVNHIHGGEIHRGHKALVVLGKELGLPGHEQACFYDDPGYHGDGNPYAVQQEFFARYIPHSIVDWFFEVYKANTDNIRNVYIDLHKACCKPDWKKERYAPIFEQLTALEQEKDEVRRNAAIEALLEKNDILKAGKGQPPREAVMNDLFGDYLANFVFDEKGGPRVQSILYLFSNLGVINSRLR